VTDLLVLVSTAGPGNKLRLTQARCVTRCRPVRPPCLEPASRRAGGAAAAVLYHDNLNHVIIRRRIRVAGSDNCTVTTVTVPGLLASNSASPAGRWGCRVAAGSSRLRAGARNRARPGPAGGKTLTRRPRWSAASATAPSLSHWHWHAPPPSLPSERHTRNKKGEG
jgi:hypothetical protein